jgi:PTH1 family peptidyl-tRNA hydrolase
VKLIVFLGNPGLKYRKTRHNVGFMVGDYCVRRRGLKWKKEAKFDAEMARDGETLLAKTQLFYNRTGDSVARIMHFYKIAATDILVVCDDLNLDFGKIRWREKGSDGGNNGLKSIIARIGENFARLRIGTDNELRQTIGDTDFVLSKLSRAEQAELGQILPDITKKIDDFIH